MGIITTTPKLDLSIGILSWHSTTTLRNTLESYKKNGLLDLTDDITIFFQETVEEDFVIANDYGIKVLASVYNMGIGRANLELAKRAKYRDLLLLEHDWELVEDKETTYRRLLQGLSWLGNNIHFVRYRHRKQPGYPLFTQPVYQGNELEHYDPEIGLKAPHLLDCIHWIEKPEEMFPDKIYKWKDWYGSKSRWGNWTNNPGMFRTNFYIETVKDFVGDGIQLEGNISKWWARQDFNVVHGEGLFKHNDIGKYGNR